MEQITIKAIWLNDTKKDGTAYLDREQRPYKMVKIATTDGRTIYGRAYQGSPLLSWKAGESHEVEITENNGYLNFKLPKTAYQPNPLEPRLKAVEDAVAMLHERVAELERGSEPDLPF